PNADPGHPGGDPPLAVASAWSYVPQRMQTGQAILIPRNARRFPARRQNDKVHKKGDKGKRRRRGKDHAPMTNEGRMQQDEPRIKNRSVSVIRASAFVILSSFVIRHSSLAYVHALHLSLHTLQQAGEHAAWTYLVKLVETGSQ